MSISAVAVHPRRSPRRCGRSAPTRTSASADAHHAADRRPEPDPPTDPPPAGARRGFGATWHRPATAAGSVAGGRHGRLVRVKQRRHRGTRRYRLQSSDAQLRRRRCRSRGRRRACRGATSGGVRRASHDARLEGRRAGGRARRRDRRDPLLERCDRLDVDDEHRALARRARADGGRRSPSGRHAGPRARSGAAPRGAALTPQPTAARSGSLQAQSSRIGTPNGAGLSTALAVEDAPACRVLV